MKIFSKKERILESLNEEEKRIYLDHFHYCTQILLTQKDKSCLVVIKKRKFKLGLSYGEILYSSDYKFLINSISAMNWFFLRFYKLVFLATDKRFVKNNPFFSVNVKMKSSYMFKTLHPNIGPKDIDNLYTELILLPF